MESPYPSYCDSCDQIYVDAAGRPCARPFVARRAVSGRLVVLAVAAASVGLVMTVAAAHEAGLYPWLAAIAWATLGGILGWWMVWLHWRSPNAQLRRGALAAVARARVGAIASQDAGVCRIRGRVRVLTAARDEDPSVGAVHRRVRTKHSYRVEVTETTPRGRSRTYMRNVVETAVTDTEECGRFAVIDDTGVAIVDDDAFRVWSLSRRLPSGRDGAFMAREGDVVEVIGPARREVVAEVFDLLPPAAGDYRASAPSPALVFNGTHEDSVWILVS